MWASLNGFKVIHNNMVLNALSIMGLDMPRETLEESRDAIVKPKSIEVLAINEDCEIVSIKDESRAFQFIPKRGD